MAATRDQRRAPPPAAAWGADVRETHSALVVLVGDRAYKVKKAVDLGFLDFTTVELRDRACRRELVLNQRLAPDVYIGVAEVSGPDGSPCESILVMRRMPDDRRLSTLVRAGVDVSQDVRHVARLVARFHAGAETNGPISTGGSPEALRTRWVDNLRALETAGVASVPRSVLDRLEVLALEYVDGRHPLLHARIADGLVKDGHGDLLADDIFCVADGPRILDCLDFSDELRWMDVLDDVASLAMDLERLGAPPLAGLLLRAHEQFTGVRQPPSLREHYIAYRAVMRAKVAAIRAMERSAVDGGPDVDEAALLCDLGLRHLDAGRVRLVLVGGTPGSGKTTLAGGLADHLGATVVSSDVERKQLAGLGSTEHAPAPYEEGIYSPQSTRWTYEQMGRRVRTLLGLGETVVVDASFSRSDVREDLRRLGAECHAPVHELRCVSPVAVVEARLAARELRPDRFSDADLAIGRTMAEGFTPWPQAAEVPTDSTPEASVAAAVSALGGCGDSGPRDPCR